MQQFQLDRCNILGALRPVLPRLQVASLQHMAVYYRGCCGLTPKQGRVCDAPDPDEEYPLQDPMYEMGEEVPSDEQEHYIVCIDLLHLNSLSKFAAHASCK